MDIRTYRARTIQEALSQVRRDLGPDAAVLYARELGTSIPWRWLPGVQRVEVSATRDGVPAAAAQPAAPSARVEMSAVPTDELRHQLEDLQATVARLFRQTPRAGLEPPAELWQLYGALLEADVPDELARAWVDGVRRRQPVPANTELSDLLAHTAELVAGDLDVSGPIRLPSGRRSVVALVGPTGVGKTTTLAKLAARFRVHERRRVGLITVDTYRIAAVDQLRTYAEIIDLPLHVVRTPHEMRGAVAALADADLVLIDTAGRSPSDTLHIEELREQLAEARPDEVHLVASCTTGVGALEHAVRQFAVLQPTALVLTKLDEAVELGHLSTLLLGDGRLPLSYVTDGQSVPDDLAVADPATLARRIVGLTGSEFANALHRAPVAHVA
jgi:flagellar biosynthesis protein FlhF